MQSSLQIIGYEQDTVCMHCNRKLLHGIKIANQDSKDISIVGADCFDKDLTEARIYQGKKYRLGSNKIRELAKVAEFWSLDKQARMGYHYNMFVFKSKE